LAARRKERKKERKMVSVASHIARLKVNGKKIKKIEWQATQQEKQEFI